MYKSILDGFKAGEVPIHFRIRRAGDSKIAPLHYIVNVLKYAISERARVLIKGPFGKFIVVGGFGFFINAIMLRFLVDRFGWVPYFANLFAE